MEQEMSSQLHQEPNYRLNIKKNHKGKISWEYSVKADTMLDLAAREAEIRSYIIKNIEILDNKEADSSDDKD